MDLARINRMLLDAFGLAEDSRPLDIDVSVVDEEEEIDTLIMPAGIQSQLRNRSAA